MNALSGNDLHGAVDEGTKKLRSSFTNNPNDNYKFKLPQLYNLADVAFFWTWWIVCFGERCYCLLK
jgi:cytochrome c peroxidase